MALHSTMPALRLKAAGFLLFLALLAPALAQPAPDPLRWGERMYREGLLPSGAPMRAIQAQGEPVPGTAYACAGCHLRSGLGSEDERLTVPPINAARLFNPRYLIFPDLNGQERAELPAAARDALRRPAYTEATLLKALREGVDPAGHALKPAMPRYILDDPQAAALAGYLKGLCADLSPGVTGTTLRFATVVTEGVPAQQREAMLATLRHEVELHNMAYERSIKRRYPAFAMKAMILPMRKWILDVWELKGAPDTWRSQLQARDQAAPALALVAGMTDLDWGPVHAFCQERGIPCVLLLTEFPDRVHGGACTIYFSGGYYAEGAAAGERAADILQIRDGQPKPQVIQVIQDSREGRTMAQGFREAMAQRGEPAALEVMAPEAALTGPFLARLLAEHRGETILALWTGPEVFPALAQLPAGAQAVQVFMSGLHLKESIWDLPEVARPFTLLTYPYRLPRPPNVKPGTSGPVLVLPPPAGDELLVRARTHRAIQVLDEGVRGMARDFYRDNLLDRIGLIEDRTDTEYPRLNFSPGRPWLSTGSLLVQVTPGGAHSLEPR